MLTDTDLLHASARLTRTSQALSLAMLGHREALEMLGTVATYRATLAAIHEAAAPLPPANVVPLKGDKPAPQVTPEIRLASIRELVGEALGLPSEKPAKKKGS
jgi:hypothetical protein